MVSFHINVFAVALPLLILMPLSCVGATATPKLLLRLIILSARLISSVLTVVVVPVTVKLPAITTSLKFDVPAVASTFPLTSFQALP